MFNSRTTLLIIFAFFFHYIASQDKAYLDSLINIDLEKLEETEKVKTLLRLGTYYETRVYNKDSAYYFFKQALDFSYEIDDEKSIMQSNMLIGSNYYDKGEYDEAQDRLTLAYELAKEQNDTISQMRSLNNLGLVLDVKGQFSEALDIYRNLLKVGLEMEHERAICLASVNLSMMMTSLKDWEAGVVEAERAIAFNKQYNNDYGLAIAYNNLSICKRFLEDYDGALTAIRTANIYAIKSNNQDQKERFFSNIAGIYTRINMPDSALYYASQGVNMSRENNSPKQLIDNLWHEGESYYLLGRHVEAAKSTEEALSISRASDDLEEIFHCYELLLKIAIKDNAQEQAISYADSMNYYNDLLFNENLSKDLAEVEAKFENEKLKNELLEKEQVILLEKVKRNRLIYLGLGLLSMVIISAISIIFWFNNRNRIKKLRLQESFNAQLIDEIDQYRKRVSQVLHDDLGHGILQIKRAINKNLNLEKIDQNIESLFDHVRSLSREQYPYQIEHVGLEDALSDLYDNFENNATIGISDEYSIHDHIIDNTTAKHLYYIIRELITNTIKHSDATKIKVELIQKNEGLRLEYIENGSYFDFREELQKSKSLGLKLIKHRMKILKGKLFYEHTEDGFNKFTMRVPLGQSGLIAV